MAAQIVDLASFRASRNGTGGLMLAGYPRRDDDPTALLARDERRSAEHRDEPRHRLDGACTLSLVLGGRQATLENISRSGVMARADLPQGPGSRVLVSVGGARSLSGLVIWKRDGLVGLEVPVGSLDTVS